MGPIARITIALDNISQSGNLFLRAYPGFSQKIVARGQLVSIYNN